MRFNSFAILALSISLGVVIEDNGLGFDPAALRPGHFGLQSMRERAVGMGGTLDVLSTDGVGTQIRVRIPRAIERHE